MKKHAMLLTVALSLSAAVAHAESAARPFTIAYAPECKALAAQLAAQAGDQPLLRAFAAQSAPLSLTPLAELTLAQRLGNLVLVGPPDAPVISEAWQHEARLIDGGMYLFGYGYWKGDIGYLEAGRNPFLYGDARPTKGRDFHAEVLTISGNTPAGIEAAARAFLEKGIVNGAVSDNATVLKNSLLNRPPLTLSQVAALPAAPKAPAGLDFLAVTLPSEVEYRNAREILGATPLTMIRYKYITAGGFPLKANEHEDSFLLYHNGLHRKATGRTLLVVSFDTPAAAQSAATAFAGRAQLNKEGKGKQPEFGWTNLSAGPLSTSVKASQLLISTLE